MTAPSREPPDKTDVSIEKKPSRTVWDVSARRLPDSVFLFKWT